MIWIVNFPFCNFYSFERYLRTRRFNFSLLESGSDLNSSDLIVLPGVGTFSQAMNYLRASNLDRLIVQHASSGGSVLGICLGMQILLNHSSESPGIDGLGLIEGHCQLISSTHNFAVPHIGWNTLIASRQPDNLFCRFVNRETLLSLSDYYFVHSYHAILSNSENLMASFDHPDGPLTASIASGKIVGLQFHPEKSGSAGYALLDHIFSL